MEENYLNKYLEYKKKYILLKNGGGIGFSPPSLVGNPPENNFILIRGKSQDIATRDEYKNLKVGVLVASNPGRPGGSLGKMDGTGLDGDYTRTNFTTQEESVVASWLQAEQNNSARSRVQFNANDTFRRNLGDLVRNGRPWGMCTPYNSISVRTIQGRDFTIPFHDSNGRPKENQIENYKFAYSLINKPLYNIYQNKCKNVDLVFVYGPNVAAEGSEQGSMSRTKVKEYRYDLDYDIFRRSVKQALKSGLIKMALNGVKVAILARVSGGIYSGNRRTSNSINSQYEDIIKEILNEQFQGRLIKSYFDKIILPC